MSDSLDRTDRTILEFLQQDARATLSRIGAHAGLGVSATRVRIHRLEQLGVISGYRAELDPAALGLSVRASMRLAVHGALYDRADDVIATLPEVVECLRISGDACYLLDVHAASVADIERIEHALAVTGTVTTEIVYSTVSRKNLPLDV